LSSNDSPAGADAASALCTRCGLCCDGTLFDSVPLRAGENTAGELAAVTATAFQQPCRALGSDKCCQQYQSRPLACRWFRCLLLTALESGEVTLSGALDIVDDTHRQLALCEAWLALHPSQSILQAAIRTVDTQTEAQFQQVERLRQRIRFHFTGSQRGWAARTRKASE
jgi:hypothetical protein